MTHLNEITDQFVDDYIFNHRNNLTRPIVGGTDWRFADIVAPAFKEILEITKAKSVLELGFNVGGGALMFLSVNPELKYQSVDIVENVKSVNYLRNKFKNFSFLKANSGNLYHLMIEEFDLVYVDGDHSEQGVLSDIEVAFKFNPKYILFDDVLHPSHRYIYNIITALYISKLEVVKLYEFNQCWQGYSFALCKNKNYKP